MDMFEWSKYLIRFDWKLFEIIDKDKWIRLRCFEKNSLTPVL